MAFPRTKQPATWQDATTATIRRIQQIFGTVDLTLDQQLLLIERAQAAVRDQGKGHNGATEYWNTFVNSLRTLVAGMHPDLDPEKLFDHP